MWPSSLLNGGAEDPQAGLGSTCPRSICRGVGDSTWSLSLIAPQCVWCWEPVKVLIHLAVPPGAANPK